MSDNGEKSASEAQQSETKNAAEAVNKVNVHDIQPLDVEGAAGVDDADT